MLAFISRLHLVMNFLHCLILKFNNHILESFYNECKEPRGVPQGLILSPPIVPLQGNHFTGFNWLKKNSACLVFK